MSLSASDHERAFVHAFVIANHKKRILWFIDHPRRRDELQSLTWHFDGLLDPQFSHEIPADGRAYLATVVPEYFQQIRMPKTCFVVSTDEELDGQQVSVDRALDSARAIIASCLPGELGFVVNEYGNCWVCRRKPVTGPSASLR